MGKRTRDVCADRLLLGTAAIVSVEEAVRLLPISDAEARAFLHDHGVIRCIDARHRFVVWGDVVAVLRGDTRRSRRPDHSEPAPVVAPEGRVPLRRPGSR